MNESTEVTLDQVEACLALFKAAKCVIEWDDSYLYTGNSAIKSLQDALRIVAEQWDW